jgi:YHS domain-containing protein
MTMVKDPVCGMEIDPKDAAATSDYEGTTYYFCAIGCKERFDADPAKFLGAAGGAATEASAAPASEPRKWWQFWRR